MFSDSTSDIWYISRTPRKCASVTLLPFLPGYKDDFTVQRVFAKPTHAPLAMEQSMPCYRWHKDVLLIDIRVQPGAKHDEIAGLHDHRLKIRINAPPVDGKANTQLVKYISQVFQVRRARVKIILGEKSRDKRLKITDPQRLPEMVF